VARLIADLDSDLYAARRRASEELAKLGPTAKPALRKALTHGATTLELRRRLQYLIDRPEELPVRLLRAVEVLEQIGSAPARGLIDAVAKGVPDCRLTQEALSAGKRTRSRE